MTKGLEQTLSYVVIVTVDILHREVVWWRVIFCIAYLYFLYSVSVLVGGRTDSGTLTAIVRIY